jgi:hypothetical protein
MSTSIAEQSFRLLARGRWLVHEGAIAVVAALTAMSGLWVALDMPAPTSTPRATVTPEPLSHASGQGAIAAANHSTSTGQA